MAITPSLVDVVRPLVTIAPLITLSIVQSTLEILKQFLLLSHALFPYATQCCHSVFSKIPAGICSYLQSQNKSDCLLQSEV